MRIEKIKNRGTLFTYNISSEWALNIYLIIGEKHNFIIDTGLGLSIFPVKKYIEQDKKSIIVINTHYHWDYIWGNSLLRDCTIISHYLCKEMMETNWDDMLKRNKRYCAGEVDICLPNLIFKEELYFPEDKIRIIYTPGHTIDSISVIDEVDRIIHVGDIEDTVDKIVPNINLKKVLNAEVIKGYLKKDQEV